MLVQILLLLLPYLYLVHAGLLFPLSIRLLTRGDTMQQKIAVISVLAGILLLATPALAKTAYDDVPVDH